MVAWRQASRVAGAGCGKTPGRGHSLVFDPDGQAPPQAWPGPTAPMGVSRRGDVHLHALSPRWEGVPPSPPHPCTWLGTCNKHTLHMNMCVNTHHMHGHVGTPMHMAHTRTSRSHHEELCVDTLRCMDTHAQHTDLTWTHTRTSTWTHTHGQCRGPMCEPHTQPAPRTLAGLTFAGREAVGAELAGVAPQPCHSGPAAALPAAGITDGVQGAFCRAVAGWGRRGCGHAVECRRTHACPPCPPRGHSRAQAGKPWKPGLHSWQVVPA